ncbi:hypothetical protein CRG98_045667 [Punica granatum]|uniref:Uncharacterized protein n=1 Tax=Punica granatum TaxID=22663 RepID=A0A2I0HQF4_PUNGR|nr:hypothetical protein CRG98_045667 [Punica granatum]
MPVYFPAPQVRRTTSLVHLATLLSQLTRASLLSCTASSLSHLAVSHATLPGLITRASLLSCIASSQSHLALASCNLAGYANPYELTFLHLKFVGSPRSCLLPPCPFTFVHRKFAEPPHSCLLQPCRVCEPLRVYLLASHVHLAISLVPFATLPGLLTRASLLSCTASSPSHLARASYNLAGSANPCEPTFLHRKFAEPPRSCFLEPCRVCSPVRVYFPAPQVRRANSLVPLATLLSLLTRASSLSCTASSPSHLARASFNLAGYANPCEFTFLHRKFAKPPRSCFLEPCRVCSPVRVYIPAPQVRQATSLVLLGTLPSLLSRASLHSCTASSPSHLARASWNLAESALPCEFTFLHRKFAKPPRSCFLEPCRVCSPVRVYIPAPQVRQATSLVLLGTLPSLLSRASLHSCTASSPSHLARASWNLAESALPCEFTFLHRKFAKPPRSCFLEPCRVCSPVRVYIPAPQVRQATSLVLLGTLPSLLSRASLHSCTASSPSHLARASWNLAESALPCEFTFLHRKFAKPPRSCFLEPCRVCSPVRVYIPAPQVRQATSLVLLGTLPSLLSRASLHSCTASSPSHLARASWNLAESALPCEFTFLHRKFAKPPRSCFLEPCRVCSPVRVYIPAPQVRQATSLVLLGTLPSLLSRASLHSCTASSPSHLARASWNLAESALPCEFTFLHRKFAKPPRSCFLEPCRVCSPVRVYIPAPQVRQATSLVLLGTLPSLLSRASLHSCTASSPSHLARASWNLAESALPCEFTFLHRKFAKPPRSCFLEPCRVCSPVRVYIPAPQVRQATSLVLLGTLPSLLSRASLHSCTASSPSHLARASWNLAESALPCEFTFLHRKFAKPPRSCFLEPCRVCSPVRVYIPAPQVRQATSLVLLGTLPSLLSRASLHSCTASSPSHLARASWNLAESALPCEFTFLHRKFAKPPRSCFLEPCRVCSPVRVYIPAPQVRQATSLVLLGTLPSLLSRASLHSCTASSPSHLARASWNLAESALPCEFTFLHRKFAKPPRSCFLEPCRVCSPVRVYIPAPQVRQATSLVLLGTLPSLLSRASLHSCTASSPSHLARASWNLAESALPCEFTFLHRKFAKPPRSCFLEPCRVCSPVRVYIPAPQVRQATSLVLLGTLPSLLSRASLHSCTASSLSHLPQASCNLARSANPCQLTFLHRKFAEPPLSCLLQPCWLTFLHRKFVEPPPSCLLQPCLVCQPARVYIPAPQVRRATSLVPLATLPMRVYFPSPQVRRATSLVPLATLLGLLTLASLISCTASPPSHLARASCNLAWSANPCQLTFMHRKFVEPPPSCLLQPGLVCQPVRVYIPAPQVRRATSLVPLATLLGLLTRASLISCTASPPSHLARASCNIAGSADPCEFNFLHRKSAEPPRSCLLQHCWVRRATSFVPLATLPGQLTRASLLSFTASSPSLLAHASCNLAGFDNPLLSRTASSPTHLARASSKLDGSANPCEFTFLHRKFAEPLRSCLLQPCRVCSPVRAYFPAPQVRRATSFVPLATLPGVLTRASLLSRTASSPSHFVRASCNLAGCAHPCELTFPHRKFAEPLRSCLLQPCRVCSPVRAYFPAPQVRRATSFVPLATLPGVLTRASLLSRTASSPSHFVRASCNLAGCAHPCELTFPHRKFAEPLRSCLLQPCRVCSPVRAYFPAPQVRRATSFVPLATLPGVLTRASLLSRTASSPSHFVRASCNLAGCAHPCELTFPHRKFAEPLRSCLLQPCRVCSPVRAYFPAPQVRRATSFVPLATLPGVLTRASLLSRTASSPSHFVRASCNLAGCAHPCELTFPHRKFAEPLRSCLLQPCRVCSPVRAYFPAPQVRRATSFVPLATLPGVLTRASLLSRTASSPSHFVRASCNLAGCAHPCELTFPHRKFAEPLRSCLLQPCRVCSPVRAYFPAPQVRRATSFVPLATLPGVLTRASLLSRTASSPSHFVRASCNLAGCAHPCELTFPHRKFAEPLRSCLLQPCRVCSPVRAYFPAPQVRRATSFVPLATLPGVLTRASLLSRTASSPSHFVRASCNLAGCAHPCELTFPHRKFAEPLRSCLLQPCRVCSPVRAYFPAPQVRRATSFVPLATLPGVLTRASLLSRTASSPSHFVRASCNLAGCAHPCELTFPHRKFAEPLRSCLLQPCRVCSPVRAYFPAPQVRRATSFVPLATLPGVLTRASLLSRTASSPSHFVRASCNLAGCAHPCELTFPHRKFAEPLRSCLLQPCRVCSPVRAYFPAPQVRRATSFVPLATLPGVLTRASLLSRTASSPSHFVRASCNLAGCAHPCELTFPHRKFAEPLRSCLLQPCRVCSPVRAYFPAPQVRRATSFVPLATLPGVLTRASLLSRTASSPSHFVRASCNLAGCAHPCELTFPHRKFAEPLRSCLLQPCRVCSPVRAYFPAPQVRRATSLWPLLTLQGQLTRASLISCTAGSPSNVARASCNLARSPSPFARAPYNLAGSANQREFTFHPRKFAEPPRSCLLQPCRVCQPVRVYFPAPQVRRATSLVPLATMLSQLTRASLLSCIASSPSHLACASCNLARFAHPCELTFLHRKFAEPPRLCLLQPCQFAETLRSCHLQPCRVCEPVRVYFPSQQVRRATSLVPLEILLGLLTRATLLSGTGSSPSHLAGASCNLAGSANQ